MEATFLGQCVLKEYEVKPNSRITEVECETLITLPRLHLSLVDTVCITLYVTCSARGRVSVWGCAL